MPHGIGSFDAFGERRLPRAPNSPSLAAHARSKGLGRDATSNGDETFKSLKFRQFWLFKAVPRRRLKECELSQVPDSPCRLKELSLAVLFFCRSRRSSHSAGERNAKLMPKRRNKNIQVLDLQPFKLIPPTSNNQLHPVGLHFLLSPSPSPTTTHLDRTHLDPSPPVAEEQSTTARTSPRSSFTSDPRYNGSLRDGTVQEDRRGVTEEVGCGDDVDMLTHGDDIGWIVFNMVQKDKKNTVCIQIRANLFNIV